MLLFMRARALLRGIFDVLKDSSFVKSVLIVMTGTAAAQVVGFAISPIISRLFTPSDFGVFGSFNAVLMVILAGATLDFSQALMLPKDNEDAINIFTLSCVSTVLITLSCLVVCLFAGDYIQNLMKAPSSIFVTMLLLGIIVGGIHRSAQSWTIRVKEFRRMSASQVIRSLSSNGSQLGFGLLKTGAMGLVFATILGEVLATLSLMRVIFQDSSVLRQSIRWRRMKEMFVEYRKFPIYSAPREVINALSRGLPVLLLSNFFGIAVAGAYAFGVRVLSVPMNFISRALRPVLFQKASETYNEGGDLALLYTKITGGLFLLVIAPSVILFIWAPPIFTWVFGAHWRIAGEFARWLILWLAVMLCNLPSTVFAQIIRWQRQAFFFNIALIVTRTLSLVLGGLFLSALHTVIVFSVVSSAMNVIWIAVVGGAIIKMEGDNNLLIKLIAAYKQR